MDKQLTPPPVYNSKQEFALNNVYGKLTRGIEYVESEQAVDGLLVGADMIRRQVGQLLQMFYVDAEKRQEKVLGEKASLLEQISNTALSAAKSGNLEQYDTVLQEVVNASVKCKESSAKMKYIKGRGMEAYDPKRAIRDCIESLEQALDPNQPKKLPYNANGNGNGNGTAKKQEPRIAVS